MKEVTFNQIITTAKSWDLPNREKKIIWKQAYSDYNPKKKSKHQNLYTWEISTAEFRKKSSGTATQI